MSGAPVWSEGDLAKHRRKQREGPKVLPRKGASSKPEAEPAPSRPGACVQVCVVEGLGISYNEAYQGRRRDSWEAKERWTDRVRAAVCRQLREPNRYPVRIIWRTYIPEGRTPRDADGCFFAEKYGVDVLTQEDILPDDSGDYVKDILLERPRRGEPMRTEIIIFEV